MYQSSSLVFVYIFIITIALLLANCSSKEKKLDCPTIEQEAVSVCRAQLNCQSARRGPRFGVGIGMGVMSNVGVGVGTSTGSGDYAQCIDQDLAKQKAASPAVKNNREPSAKN